jgi:hypothetical protein
MQEPTWQARTSNGLERIASSLRVWIGRKSGPRGGLSNKARTRIVEYCLKTSKMLVGLSEVDDGYVSASVKDEETSS